MGMQTSEYSSQLKNEQKEKGVLRNQSTADSQLSGPKLVEPFNQQALDTYVNGRTNTSSGSNKNTSGEFVNTKRQTFGNEIYVEGQDSVMQGEDGLYKIDFENELLPYVINNFSEDRIIEIMK